MLSSSKRALLLAAAAFLFVAATFTPAPTPLSTCPSLRCPNGTILTCTVTPCSILDNCAIICAGHIDKCPGQCIIQ